MINQVAIKCIIFHKLNLKGEPVFFAIILGFGYGKKTDLDIGKNRHNVVPPPDTYNLNSFVEINKMHQKGFTPRQGREEVAPVSYIPS